MTVWQQWFDRAARGRERHHAVRAADPTRHPRPGRRLDLASNDYLGLVHDPRLAADAADATRRFGAGAGASRVVTGTTEAHTRAEDELARLTGQPAGLVFSSGYTANLGLLAALGGPGTLMVLDDHVHASLIDGARLSRSVVATVRHADIAAVDDMLGQRTASRAVVIVESVYSVLGDAADLTALAAVCRRHDALLVVDEAHGIGVLGQGRGAVHAAGLAGDDHVVVTATLSKALGAQGGAVLGGRTVRDHLVNTARTFLFDTGLAPAAAAAAARACRIIADEPDRVARLHQVADRIAAAARIAPAPGAVQSIPVGSAATAERIRTELQERDVLVGCFRPPSVPDGICRIRLTARATVDPDEAAAAARDVARMGVSS